VRSAHGEVLLALGELRQRHANRAGLLHSQPAAEGKALFERAVDKGGKPIAEFNRRSHCHSGPKGADQKSFDVGTHKATDNVGPFDTPQLTNIAPTAPYLHDGSARTLEEIWTIYNKTDLHGRTNDLTNDELYDLIEFLKTR
jgi:cytochrome c peroxidase